jgi:hypothetical protein
MLRWTLMTTADRSSDMSFELNSERRGNFLHFQVTGTNTAETVLAYMAAIQETCNEQDCFRVLIEENLEGPRFDEMEVFALISEGSPDALGVFEAIAYVDAQQDFDVVKFAETVAVNRGIPIAAFSSVSDAENWMRHRSEDASGQDIFMRGDED